ncbi:MAG: hypothetical protein CL928_09330 [Deltaproteobacteria bacterium]|nr:hypothetical protein [Deltaproteobacteria bacterium]
MLVPATVVGAPKQAVEEAGVLVDQVVATVNQTPISASQVALEGAIRNQVAQSAEPSLFGRLLTESSEPLEALIFREILRQQPVTRTVMLDNEVEASKRLDAFEASFESAADARAFRQAWGLTDATLLDYFQEGVLLEAAIDLAVDPKITEEEERNYYEKNKNQVFGGRDLAEVSHFVTQQVYLLKFEAEYNAWRSRLRAGATKRYLVR